jgi:DNA-binding beta-propeller fold protein YncE
VEAVGDQGAGDNQFNNPAGIAFDGGETFFITDSGNQRVVTLFEGTFRDNFAASPFGVAVNTVTADVYVTGTGTDTSALFRFTSNGVLLGTFGSFGGGIEQFRNPLGVAIDDKGGVSTNQVFVADTRNSRIQRMSATGFFTARFGREGSGDGEFRNPEGIAIAADRSVVVADTGNNRIQVLTQGGSLIHAFGSQGSGDGQFNRPVGVAINENGDLLVVDQGNNRVQRFSSDGQFLDAFGRQGSGIGQFDRPTGITVGNSGVIAVVDSGNHRVQGFFSPASPSDNLSIETQSSFLQPSASDSGKRKPNSQDPSHQDRKRGVGPSRR